MTAVLSLRTPDRPEPLDDDELRAIVESEIQNSVNHSTSQIAQDQEDAIKYYEGQPFGNEVAGASSVVLRDVAETIDWAMPALMRSFFMTNDIAEYLPTSPDDEPLAKIRTKVVNEMFRQYLRGFRITYDWAKAGLLEKFATVKFWIEKVREPIIEAQSGLTAEQLVLLVADANVELLEATDRTIATPSGPVEVFDLRFKRWTEFPRLRLETVPPEEFLCSRRATRLDQEIPFVAHRRQLPRSDLVSWGLPWEVVSQIPPSSLSNLGDARATTRMGEDSPDVTASGRKDKASQEVTITESYLRVDYDGDGYSELRRVLTGGDSAQTLLEHDYAPLHGFAGWTPIPMPHKLYGRGYFDVVADLQRIRSTLARQLIDNIVRTNNARHKIKVESVDLDSYLDSEPGAPVLVEEMDAIEALDVPPLQGWAFEALGYFEKVREQRTGIHPYSQEVYAAGQNQTAQGVSQVFEAAMAQIQLLAQMLGEGLSDLFRIIPRMMRESGMGPDRIRVGEEWIDYDPQEWPTDVRVSVQVGLSPGMTEQKIQRLLMLLGLQKEVRGAFGPGYMVTDDQIFATGVRLVEQCGFINPNSFFLSPAGKEPPQPPPSPEEIKAQSEAQSKQAQAVLDLAKLEFEKEKERQQQARLERDAQREHERAILEIEAQERAQKYAADKQFEASVIQSRAQLTESEKTTAEGARTQESAAQKKQIADLTARLAAVETRPRGTRRTVKKSEGGYSIEEEQL